MKHVLLLLLLIPAFALPCATPCTQLGQPGYIDPQGACIPTGQTARIDEFSWSTFASNTSTLILNGSATCLCGEAAFCNITLNSNGTETVWSNQLQDYAYAPSSLAYGTNPLMLNCTCNSTNVSATKNATALQIQSEIYSISSDPIISPGHVYQTTISVKNKGNVESSFQVYDRDYRVENCTASLGSPLSSLSSTALVLSPLGQTGDYGQALFNRTLACGYLGEAIHSVQACESTIGCPGTDSIGGCFDVYGCYDYGGSWNPDLDCSGCGPGSDTCSNFNCCAYHQHWENGACCDLGESCCLLDSECPDSFRCHGSFHYCVALSGVGAACTELDDCQLNLHCDADSSLPVSYCTYNTSSDAGLPAGQCWDEEEWNVSDPYYGCDGCRDSDQCNATYYCYSSYAFCRTCPFGPGSVDEICDGAPSLNCFDLDLDCCVDDDNCTSRGEGYYCDVDSRVCRHCQTRQDYYCPSSICYGVDPDCCITGSSCPIGTACDGTGTCVPQAGAECSVSSDCGAGNLVCKHSACSKKSVCMVPRFINVQPSVVPKPLIMGQALPLSVQVTNPQGCPSSYRVYFTGPSRHFAFFGPGRQESNFTLAPGETKNIPARIFASTLGKLALEINVVDSHNPTLHDLVSLEATVQGYSTNPGEVVTAPELSAMNVLLLLLGSIALYSLRIDS